MWTCTVDETIKQFLSLLPHKKTVQKVLLNFDIYVIRRRSIFHIKKYVFTTKLKHLKLKVSARFRLVKI